MLSILGWAIAISIWVLIRYFHLEFGTVAEEFYKNNPHREALDSVVKQLRRQATLIRLSSHIVLGLAVSSGLLGTYIFSHADNKASAVRYYDARERDSYQEELLQRLLRLNEYYSESEGYEKESLKEEIESLEARLSALRSSTTKAEESDLKYVATLVASKVGSVFILLFLVRIFIHVYRYLLPLTAFYDARADCMQVSKTDVANDLKELL